ncbi:hypothetical protein RJ641_004038, partial [Dillenia turbinata]
KKAQHPQKMTHQNPKQEDQETMKKTLQASISSSSSTTASTASAESDQSEFRDSGYFLGCRKDANCHCEMCLASINATLDLMPASAHRSSLTKLSASKPNLQKTPISFNGSSVTPTPKHSNRWNLASPALKSTAKISFKEEKEEKKRRWDLGLKILRLILCMSLIFGSEFGVSWMALKVLKPKLSTDLVRDLVEQSSGVQDLSGRLSFLKTNLEGFVNVEVSNCSIHSSSSWGIHQDGLMLHSKCVFYKSVAEEVSIWGWPLQTSGLLTAGLSSRSFIVLSGRLTEWLDGNDMYLIREVNDSWVQGKWRASVIHLDPNTRIIEYRRSVIMENSGMFSAAFELLEFSTSRLVKRMKKQFWLSFVFGEAYGINFRSDASFAVPT